jgi:predicted RNA binding protein YcfA (HicA-like mRNA interferase family)
LGKVVTAREIIRKLKEKGFEVVSQSGSHAKFVHRERPTCYAIVPLHSGGREVKKGTLKSIERTSGVKFK